VIVLIAVPFGGSELIEVPFRLMPGQAHDLVKTRELLAGVCCQSLLADKAFDADWLRELLAERSIEAVIPPKSNRKNPASCDMEIYKWRHLVENFLQKLKELKRVAMRACKTGTSFEAMMDLSRFNSGPLRAILVLKEIKRCLRARVMNSGKMRCV
jgi:transposase